jgi:hypothetical protein
MIEVSVSCRAGLMGSIVDDCMVAIGTTSGCVPADTSPAHCSMALTRASHFSRHMAMLRNKVSAYT